MQAVFAESLAPGGFRVFSRRRFPAHFPTEEGGGDKRGMKQHPHRRQQHGKQQLDHHAHRHPKGTAEQFRAAQYDQQHTQDLRQEQQGCRCAEQCQCFFGVPLRPYRKQLSRLDEVLRLDQRVQGQHAGRQGQEQEP